MPIRLNKMKVHGQAGITTAEHDLDTFKLFSDEALIDAIERHPPELMDITVQGSFKTCNRNGFSSADLLEAVKQGQFWINLRRLETVDSPLGKLVKQMHVTVNKKYGRKTSGQIGGLLISSPTATVGYHFDLTEVTLWHMRGHKRIFIYPKKEPFVTPQTIESIALTRGVEKIPYSDGLEVAAKAFDLTPGKMISWEHLSPHRVDNVAGLNVSVTLEANTLASRLRVGGHFFDGLTRKKMGKTFFEASENKVIQLVKTGIALTVKKLGQDTEKYDEIVYAYDLSHDCPDFLKPLDVDLETSKKVA